MAISAIYTLTNSVRVRFAVFLALFAISAMAQEWKAGETLNENDVNAKSLDKWFVAEEIPEEVFARMSGKSFSKSCTVSRKSLRYLKVLHYNKDGKIQRGEIVCNKSIANDLIDIFIKLYEAKYKIERMVLVDNYDAVDEKTMAANNTSCFNFRFVSGTKRVSKHGLGRAIDINPLYNPCYNVRTGKCEPSSGKIYATNRTDNKRNPMLINKQDLCYKLFIQHGFRWGGAWRTKKDYQHFEK